MISLVDDPGSKARLSRIAGERRLSAAVQFVVGYRFRFSPTIMLKHIYASESIAARSPEGKGGVVAVGQRRKDS